MVARFNLLKVNLNAKKITDIIIASALTRSLINLGSWITFLIGLMWLGYGAYKIAIKKQYLVLLWNLIGI